MTAEGGGMIPPDYSVEAEGPRDICANLAQVFQGYAVYSRAEMAQSYPHPYHFGEWAARLRLAVRQLDAEQIAPGNTFSGTAAGGAVPPAEQDTPQ